MSLTTGALIPNAQFLHTLSLRPTSGDYPLQILVDNALNAAAGSGLFTATVTITGYNAQLVNLMVESLTALDYTVVLTSTTMTVSW